MEAEIFDRLTVNFYCLKWLRFFFCFLHPFNQFLLSKIKSALINNYSGAKESRFTAVLELPAWRVSAVNAVNSFRSAVGGGRTERGLVVPLTVATIAPDRVQFPRVRACRLILQLWCFCCCENRRQMSPTHDGTEPAGRWQVHQGRMKSAGVGLTVTREQLWREALTGCRLMCRWWWWAWKPEVSLQSNDQSLRNSPRTKMSHMKTMRCDWTRENQSGWTFYRSNGDETFLREHWLSGTWLDGYSYWVKKHTADGCRHLLNVSRHLANVFSGVGGETERFIFDI